MSIGISMDIYYNVELRIPVVGAGAVVVMTGHLGGRERGFNVVGFEAVVGLRRWIG